MKHYTNVWLKNAYVIGDRNFISDPLKRQISELERQQSLFKALNAPEAQNGEANKILFIKTVGLLLKFVYRKSSLKRKSY